MKQDSAMRAGLRELGTSAANQQEAAVVKDQLMAMALRKENLMKMIGLIEADIMVKEKEMSKVK